MKPVPQSERRARRRSPGRRTRYLVIPKLVTIIMANSTTALPSVDSWSTSGMDSSRVLYLGVCLALLSSVSQIGKGLQKLGVDSLPELTLTPRTVKRYLGTRIWVLGVGLDIFGALIGLAALSMLPVSVAQPIFANGLVLLALFSYFYLKAPP